MTGGQDGKKGWIIYQQQLEMMPAVSFDVPIRSRS